MARKREDPFRIFLEGISQAYTSRVWCKLIVFALGLARQRVKSVCFSMLEILNFLKLLCSEGREAGDGSGLQ